jgi:hypothetical protein
VIDITGPSFKCTDFVAQDLYKWVNKSYPHIPPMPYLFAASADKPARRDPSHYSLAFHMRWKQANEDVYQNLSCVAYESTYTLVITYVNGQQSIKAQVRHIQALSSAGLYEDFAVTPMTGGLNSTINATSIGSTTNGNLIDINRRSNLAAVQDSLVRALSGYIGMFSTCLPLLSVLQIATMFF